MRYEAVPSRFFREQISKLSNKDKEIIKGKIELIELNPYRFKAIHSKKFSKVFRVWLNLSGKKTRMIYVIIEPRIIIACLILRKKDYKDLEKYLEKIKI